RRHTRFSRDWSSDVCSSGSNYNMSRLSSDIFKSDYLEYGGLPSPGNLGQAIRLEEGGEIGSFYGKKFAGFNDDGKWLFEKADGKIGRASCRERRRSVDEEEG